MRTLERAYLRSDDVRRQSGFGGDEVTWRARRLAVAGCLHRDGSFLDVGCANGYLAESVVRWCAERGVRIEPYGVDLAPRLVDLARRRLPMWADRFWVGDALTWAHPGGHRFDAVHVLLEAVPARLRPRLVRHHLAETVAPGGRLLVSDYTAPAGARMGEVLAALGFDVDGWSPSLDPERPTAGTAWIERP